MKLRQQMVNKDEECNQLRITINTLNIKVTELEKQFNLLRI